MRKTCTKTLLRDRQFEPKKASVCIILSSQGGWCSRSDHRLMDHQTLTLSSTDGRVSNILKLLINSLWLLGFYGTPSFLNTSSPWPKNCISGERLVVLISLSPL